MDLEHSFTIPVPPQQAWQALLDVERVAPCMPGATVDSVDGDVINGRIKVKVGPVSLTYSGTARFAERDEQARSVTLEASGKETRGSGTASATVRSLLEDEGGGQTRVVVHTTMNVTGRPAQFGRGVLAEVGGKIIERFAANLATQLAGGRQAAGQAAGNGADSGSGTPAASGTGTAVGNGAGTAAAGGTEPASAGGPGTPAGPGTGGSGTGGPGTGGSAAVAQPVEDLGLPVRAFNSLRREGIHTVASLTARTERDLLAIEGLGPQSVKEIKQKLAGRGLALSAAASTAGTPTTTGAAGTGDTAAAAGDTAGTAEGTAGTAEGTAGSAGSAATAGSAAGAAGGTPATAGSTAGTAGGTPEAARDTLGTAWDTAGRVTGPASHGDASSPPAPLRAVRPPDEEALDLLSVAGFPVLKRLLPAAGAAALLLLLIVSVFRRRGQRRG